MKRYIGSILLIFALLSLSSCFKKEHEHTPEQVAAKAASCAEGGCIAHYRCTECEKLFSDAECKSELTAEEVAIAPSGHAWGEADCTTPATCSVCGTAEGDALGHDWSGECDTECNRESCSATREAKSHLDSDENGICDNCGEAASSDIPVSGDGSEFLPPDEF